MSTEAGSSSNRDDLRSSFRRGFAATFVLDMVSRLLGVVTLVVLIRGLSVSGYADYTLFLAISAFASNAAGGGVRMRHLRMTAERESRGAGTSWPSFSSALATTTALLVAVSVVGVGVDELAHAAGSTLGRDVFIYACLYAIGLAATDLAIAHYQALRRFLLAGSFNVLRAAMLLATAGVIVGAELGSSEKLLLVFAIGSLAIGAVACLPMVRSELVARGKLTAGLRLDSEARWLTLYYIAIAGFAYVDVLVAGALLDDKEIATLGASLRYIAVVLGMFPAINSILKVRSSQIDVVDSLENQRELMLAWIRRSALPAAIGFAVFVVAAPFVIPLVDGGRYPGSILAFQIYLTAAVGVYVTAPASNLLMAQLRSAWLTMAVAVALLANLLGDIAVARPLGVAGIAAVSSAIYLTLEIALVIAALRGPVRLPDGRMAEATPGAPARSRSRFEGE